MKFQIPRYKCFKVGIFRISPIDSPNAGKHFQQILVYLNKMRKGGIIFVLIYINCKGGGLGAAEAPRSYRVKAIILCVLGVSSIWYLTAKK